MTRPGFQTTIDECQLKLEYSSFQLERFFLNTCINPGTRLQPINVDNMVRVIPYPPLGSDVDPYISEVPYELGTISWSIEDTGHRTSSKISEPVLCFVEIYSLNSDKDINRNYWEQYFILDDDHSIVAPNGALFQTSDDLDKISIDLQKDKDQGGLLFGYGVVFTIKVEKGGEKLTYYCRKDPVANLRSRSTT